MLRYIKDVIAPVGTAQVEDVCTVDERLSAEDFAGVTVGRSVPVLHVHDSLKNEIFENEYKITVELTRGVFGFACNLPEAPQAPLGNPTTRTSLKESIKESIRNSIKGSTKSKTAALHLSGKPVACKIYVSQDEDYNVNYVAREIEVLNLIYNPYVTNLYAHYESPSGHRLIMDYFSGRLSTVISHRGYCELYAANIIRQVLLGVVHLHSRGIVHRALTPECIMVDIVSPNKVAHAKISGFGHAAILSAQDTLALFGPGSSKLTFGSGRQRSSKGASVKSSKSSKRQDYDKLESQPEYPEESPQELLLHNPPSTSSDPTAPSPDIVPAVGATVEIAAVKMDSGTSSTAVPCKDESTRKNSAQSSRREDEEGGLEMKDTTDRSPALITRPPPALKYVQSFTYHTSVRYDEVPFKEYDKLADGLSEGPYADFSYLAPEMLLGQYGPQVDSWAVGCIAHCILTGHVPFTSSDGPSSRDMVAAIIDGTIPRGPVWRVLSEQSRAFVSGLLCVDPLSRHCPEEALQQQWIEETARVVAMAHCRHDESRGQSSYEADVSSGAALGFPSHEDELSAEQRQYTFIISPHRATLRRLQPGSRTSSNISSSGVPGGEGIGHVYSKDQNDGPEDSTDSPTSDVSGQHSRRPSEGGSGPGPELSPTDRGRVVLTGHEEVEGEEEDERADFMFDQF